MTDTLKHNAVESSGNINSPVAIFHYKPMESGITWRDNIELQNGTNLYVVPEGYCIVPIEPTEGMWLAVQNNGFEGDKIHFESDYKAMIEAFKRKSR